MTRKQTTYQLQHQTIHNTTLDSDDSENFVIKEIVFSTTRSKYSSNDKIFDLNQHNYSHEAIDIRSDMITANQESNRALNYSRYN